MWDRGGEEDSDRQGCLPLLRQPQKGIEDYAEKDDPIFVLYVMYFITYLYETTSVGQECARTTWLELI